MPAPKWKSVDELRPHLDRLVDELGRMPRTRDLSERGEQHLVRPIYKFGGFSRVAQLLGYPYSSGKGPRRWTSVADLSVHLDPMVNTIGHMPEHADLKEAERHDLIAAIQKFGGSRHVADVLGYPTQRKRVWETVEDLRPDLDPIVGKLGRMPTREELRTVAVPGLREAIRKFGGYYVVATDLGYPYRGRKPWDTVEDLRPYLDPMVTELGRMPLKPELERVMHLS